jgi:hypothetical protein
MDLNDLPRSIAAARHAVPITIDPHDLVAQIGSEVASALSMALERVNQLATTGTIDRAGLQALRDEIERARLVGMMGQQVSRFASGRVHVARERLNLTALLHEALRQRGREIDARGLEVRQVLAPAEVMGDATLMFTLLQALLDWSFEHAVSRIDLGLDVRNWPSVARLACSFQHQPPDQVDSQPMALDAENEDTLDTMSWRLLHQTAAVLGLRIARKDTPGRTSLAIEFPDTLAPRLDSVSGGLSTLSGPEFAESNHLTLNSKPLAGRHVLAVAARRELRNTIRESLRPLGLMLDFVTSVEEAAAFCRGSVPHAIVYERGLGGERFERLRREMLAAVPNVAFVEIADEGRGFETVQAGGRPQVRVARDAVLGSLAAALSYELTRLAGHGS